MKKKNFPRVKKYSLGTADASVVPNGQSTSLDGYAQGTQQKPGINVGAISEGITALTGIGGKDTDAAKYGQIANNALSIGKNFFRKGTKGFKVKKSTKMKKDCGCGG